MKHDNTCKQACSYVCIQEHYIKHVFSCIFSMHAIAQLVLTFTPHYIIMVKGLLINYNECSGGNYY